MSDLTQNFIARLSRAKRVLITTHVRPDGDALGTTAALSLALKKINIDSHVVLLSHLPSKYAFIYRENKISHEDVEAGWGKFSLDSFDTLLVADTGTWSQLPGLREQLKNWPGQKLVLDHHLTQEDWADAKLVVTQAAAAAEVAGELISRWPIEIDSAIATALYVGIVSDTGWFQYANTRPATHRLAATLIEKGVDTDRIYQALYQNERAQRVALHARALQSMQLLADGRFSLMSVSKKDFADVGAAAQDTEALINIPLQIRTVEVSAVLTEPPEGGPIRVSLRSKGQLDCAKFAEQFGGGGHARAAGLKLETTLEAAREKLSGAILDALKKNDQ